MPLPAPTVTAAFTSTLRSASSVMCPLPLVTVAFTITSLVVPRASSSTSPVPLALTPVVSAPPLIVIVPPSATSLIGPFVVVVVRSSSETTLRVSATLVVELSKSDRTTSLIDTLTAAAVSTVIAPPATISRR